ncbi:unnamed protein product [Discula destructiva]
MRSLRNGLDRDVYQIVRKYEDEITDNGTSKAPKKITISAVYEYIQRSNSSLKRQKKRPLEDALERVLDIRREEAKADRDTDEELELELQAQAAAAAAASAKRAREDKTASLLNKQLTKHWNFTAASPSTAVAGAPDAMDVDSSAATPGDRQANGEAKPKRRRKDPSRPKEIDRSPQPGGPTLDDMAGMEEVIDRLTNPVYIPLVETEMLAEMGHRPKDGVLLHGPSGCGKTSLAHAMAADLGVAFIPVSTQSLVGGMSGESEKNIRDVFDEALRIAPCLIFLDELDTIAGKRDSAQKAMEGRIIAEISSGMDRIKRRREHAEASNGDDEGRASAANVVVLAATNKPDNIDPTIRRRFGVEVEIGMPNEPAREAILRTMTLGYTLAEDVDFAALARLTPGYVGADLEHVVNAAAYKCARSIIEARTAHFLSQPDLALEHLLPLNNSKSAAGRAWRLKRASRAAAAAAAAAATSTSTNHPAITMANLTAAISSVQPAAKREGFSAIPDTTWAHVGALRDVRRKLEMSIIGPIKNPARFAAVGIKAAAGILLWGPPGCGKTLVAKAVANESKANFISIKGPELLNKYVGESERAVRSLFARARGSAPCILFFDEMDALVPKRDDSLSDASSRVVNAFLTELDGTGDRSGIYVVGATNRPDCIDPAIRRPGRLGTSVFVGLPSAEERVDILRTIYHNTIGKADMDEGLRAIALDKRCQGFSGADLGSLMQAAAQASLERRYEGMDITADAEDDGQADEILPMDWEKAMNEVKPSVKDDGRYDPHLLDQTW